MDLVNGSTSLCITATCIAYAAHLLVNFCSGTRENFDDGESEIVQQSVNNIVRQLIESDYETAISHKTLLAKRDAAPHEAKDLFTAIQANYNSCLNVTQLRSQGLSPLHDMRDKIMELFPVPDLNSNLTMTGPEPMSCPSAASPASTAPTASNATLSRVLLYLTQIQVVPSFGLAVAVSDNPLEPERTVVTLGPIPSDDYNSDLPSDEAATVGEQVGDILNELLADRKETDFASLGHAVVHFQSQIRKIIDSHGIPDNVLPKMMTLDEVAVLAPPLGLDGVIRALVPASVQNDTVAVEFPPVVASISQFISNTPVAVIQAYLLYQMVESFRDFAWVDDETGDSPRWITCVKQALSTGPSHLLNHMFAMAAVPQESRDVGENIWAAIKQQFLRSLKGRGWVSDQVKRDVQQKLANMGHTFVSSPEFDSLDKVTAEYNDLELTSDYLKNQLAYRRWDTQKHFGQAGKPPNRRDAASPTRAGASYYPIINSIFINGPFLRHPSASRDYPDVFNFGGLGNVLGHELTHGFDDSGRKYDQNGRHADWWDNNTVAEFEKRAECFVRQYDAFSLPTSDNGQRKQVNGTKTLTENIADAGGINLAFDAWKATNRRNTMKLPGLDRFTIEKQFFIASMVPLCTTNRGESNLKALLFDNHTPDPARIRGLAENSRGFRAAFNCPVKEPTCELW
ncbi:hypothetical protein L249_5591 [Ophiocordyceps polyrhachis-furcata BCC 54312]|uniref:Peptidase M13 C-terminal domain-containing protein n=1 Tax=Ophiocordyceps polyrhachis-furcata BCC 54312 TaxID=1330021 RepID=A0A367LGM2_9HYPO|nr:hypothetical protein L249_5591 [Ophiocordyceps polyrhachis-furcata BCC 54312]